MCGERPFSFIGSAFSSSVPATWQQAGGQTFRHMRIFRALPAPYCSALFLHPSIHLIVGMAAVA